MSFLIIWASLTCFMLSVADVGCFTVGNETALRKSILEDNSYDMNVRPDMTVNVAIRFNLLAIHDLSIKDQTFTVTGWLTTVWTDRRLSWRGDRFGDVRFMFANEEKVWRPVLIVSNSVNSVGVIQDEYTPFRISMEGRVIWDPIKIFVVNCEADITYYPFDSQECRITIQSWSYNLREVDIKSLKRAVNTDRFKPNGEWILEGVHYVIDETTDIKNDTYSRINYFFKLKRRSEYYFLNVLFPVLINSLLMTLVFALPAESGEKMGYSLTVLLSFVVLLTLVADKIPSTSIATSIIVVYFALVLVLSAVSVFLTTVILDIYFRSPDQAIPSWLQFLSKIISQMVCYKTDCFCQKNLKAKSVEVAHVLVRQDSSKSNLVTENFPDEEYSWKDISKILDRFFLCLYLTTLALITIGFMAAVIAN